MFNCNGVRLRVGEQEVERVDLANISIFSSRRQEELRSKHILAGPLEVSCQVSVSVFKRKFTVFTLSFHSMNSSNKVSE